MLIRRILTLLALPVTLGAAPARIAAQQPSPDSLAAERAVRDIFNAIARADTATLRALLDDDLHWIVASTGAVVKKSQLVAAAANTVVPMTTNEYAVDSVRPGETALSPSLTTD